MLQLEPRGEVADYRNAIFRKALECEQELMLLRFDAHRPRCLLTEMDELSDLKTELRERPILFGRNLFPSLHASPHCEDISYYDTIVPQSRC
jgi:hypothetical protein